MRLTGYLQLAAIAIFTFAVVALVLGKNTVATALFIIAMGGFLATIILQRNR